MKSFNSLEKVRHQEQVKAPVKYKQFLLTWSTIYPLITMIFELFGNWLLVFPVALRILLVSGVTVFLMTYIFMPLLIRQFGGWLRR